MKKLLIALAVVAVIVLMIFAWYQSTYNGFVTARENVEGSWAQVQNVYQRRADLIPNLVETVKGFAAQEKDVLTQVTEARASVGKMTVTKEVLDDPAAFQKFQKAQDGLAGALQRLMVVSENYPQLRSNENFLTLQSQLEGTENRIAVERKRFNDAVQDYNTRIKRFPAAIVAGMGGFQSRPYFEATSEAQTTPKVKFGK